MDLEEKLHPVLQCSAPFSPKSLRGSRALCTLVSGLSSVHWAWPCQGLILGCPDLPFAGGSHSVLWGGMWRPPNPTPQTP